MAYVVKITYCDTCPITQAANDGMPVQQLRGVACLGNGCPDQHWEVIEGPPLVDKHAPVMADESPMP